MGAYLEDSSETGVGGSGENDDATYAGATYVYKRSGEGQWPLDAYVKATNTEAAENFGFSVALSADGTTLAVDGDILAVGARQEDGDAYGIDGDQASNDSSGAGAVYVYTRDTEGHWSHQSYVKASNTGAGDEFGRIVALSGDGETLAVGAPSEGSSATRINGEQSDNTAQTSGAVYLY